MHWAQLFPSKELAHFCQHHGIGKLAVFGSAVREDLTEGSDIDLLVEFSHGKKPGLFELMTIEEALTQLLGRRVDLVERASVEASDNYVRRRHILDSAQDIYVAR